MEEGWDNLPEEEIEVEILCRLPRKSLCRFKCVSKHWRELISNVQPKTTKGLLGFLCRSYPAGLPDPHYIMTCLRLEHEGGASIHHSIRLDSHHPYWYYILNSCNGFLLFCDTGVRWDRRYYVYNPAGKLEQILRPRNILLSTYGALAFVDAHHFMAIFFSCSRSGSHIHFNIYSSKDKTWSKKKLRSPNRRSITIDDDWEVQSLFFKGAMHWLLTACLLIYHLQGEFCKVIKLPDDCSPYEHGLSGHIWNFEGRLHCCQIRNNEINVWVLHMEEHDYTPIMQCLEWQHKHRGILVTPDLVDVTVLSATTYLRIGPFAFNEDFEILYIGYEDSVISYHLGTGRRKVVYTCSRKKAGFQCFHIGAYPPFLIAYE